MAGEETTPAGFLIDGREYPIPDVNTFSIDEDELLWDYAGLAREDFVPVDPDEDDAERLEAERRRKLRHPGLMRTLLHVAYQRGNPQEKTSVIKRLVGQTTLSGAMSLLVAEEPDDADDPPRSVTTSTPSESSPTGSSVTDDSTKQSPETSGNGTKSGSDVPAGQPEPTGTGR